MDDKHPILPFLMQALRLNPAVDLGATMAELVRGKGSAASALAFLPFLGWAKKAKTGIKLGSELLSDAARATHLPDEVRLGASALKAGERQWVQGLGGTLRAAPPLPLARLAAHSIEGASVPFFRTFPETRANAKLGEEMWANMQRFAK